MGDTGTSPVGRETVRNGGVNRINELLMKVCRFPVRNKSREIFIIH